MKWMLFLVLVPLVSSAQKIASKTLLRDVEYLSSDSLKGRKTGTPENRIAAAYIAKRFKSLRLQSYYEGYMAPFVIKNRSGQTIEGVNVLGFIPGRREDVIVISAHFDHIGVINGLVYNGADDNASGVAGLMALAAYFSKNKPNHTLLFAAFDAEEMGLQGSKAFVANPPVPMSKIKVDLNMDMISHNDKGELYVAGTFKNPGLKQFLPQHYLSVQLIEGHDDPKLGNDDWTNQSDQGSFNNKGIPFLYFGVEDHKDYHKETDQFKNINKRFFIDAVEAIKHVIAHIDKKL